MKYTDIKNQSETQLRDLVGEKQTKIRELRFKASAAGLKETHLIRDAKRAIARAKTAAHARRMTEEKNA